MADRYIIDNRKTQEIRNRMEELARSYTPEWNMTFDDPDIGSTIAQIYATQVAENIERVNNIIDRYHMEFVNLIDVSVRPAIPSQGIVLMEVNNDSVDGSYVPAGTKLLASGSQGGNDESLVFETVDNVFVTSARINQVFMTNFEDGTVASILGNIEMAPALVPAVEEEKTAPLEEAEEDIFQDSGREHELMPESTGDKDKYVDDIADFTLFGKQSGIQRNMLFIYHASVFDVENNDIFIRFSNASELVESVVSRRRRFCYVSEGELISVEDVELLDDGCTFRLRKNNRNEHQLLEDKVYGLIAIVDNEPVTERVYADAIEISAKGDKCPPEYIGNNLTELSKDDFLPFSDNISLYQECYVGSDEYFSKKGAVIELEFDVSYERNDVKVDALEKEEDLRVIKKKQREPIYKAPPEVYVDTISVEYYNNVGWKKLEADSELRFIFAKGEGGHIKIRFKAPSDWEDTTAGGYEGRVLRFMVTKADNCYFRPATHFYPRVKNMQVSFSYEAPFMKPDALISFYGTRRTDITRDVMTGDRLTLFRPTGYNEDALYLALSKRPEQGPISLFIRIEEHKHYEPLACVFEYTSRDGFKPLKVIDGTQGMCKSGNVLFQPPADMCPRKIEGRNACYIRIRRNERIADEYRRSLLPKIADIRLNGIRVANIDTGAEQDYYLDEITPFARFRLPERGILDADVWVNEFGTLSSFAMKELLIERPHLVRAEYDIQGKISSFFVKWQETDRLDAAEDKRVYELDRLTSELIFGDGVHTDIPRCTNDVSLKVAVRTSDGYSGNVEENCITSALGNINFVGSIFNPVKAYGGLDIEGVDAAMERGANIISGRRRLVSMKDYINEIYSFSTEIDKVIGVSGYDDAARVDSQALTFVVLLKDFMNGSASYHKLKEELKDHLAKNCEITIPEDKLFVAQPLFVDVSVQAWIKASDIQDTFNIQSSILEELDHYLNPLTDEYSSWGIGEIPTYSQLQMKINLFKNNAIIRNIAVTVSYTDTSGRHEMDLRELKPERFMVIRSGVHNIHVEV